MGPVVEKERDTSLNGNAYCDESRCVSPSVQVEPTAAEVDDNDERSRPYSSFSCYAKGTDINPYACTDGFVGHPVGQSENNSSDYYNNCCAGAADDENPTYYYTCCTPNYYNNNNNTNSTHGEPAHSELSRHCTDPIELVLNDKKSTENNDSTNDTLKIAAEICADKIGSSDSNITANFTYPRMMTKTFGHDESLICCDTDISGEVDGNARINYLEENNINCVPYHCDDIGQNCVYTNYWGSLEFMMCNDPANIYQYPKAVASSTSEIRFECCKETSSMDRYVLVSYKRTLWPVLILSSVSLVTSLLLITSLTIPLAIGCVRKMTDKTTDYVTVAKNSIAMTKNRLSSLIIGRYSCGTSTSASSSSVAASQVSVTEQNINRRRTSSTVVGNGAVVNAFNMYLVYLSLPDLIFNIIVVMRTAIMIHGEGGSEGWSWLNLVLDENVTIDHVSDGVLMCTVASITMNSVIVYEIYTLLLNSSRLRRQPPPKLSKGLYQALAVYVTSIIIGFVFGIINVRIMLKTVITYVITTLIPACYVAYICYMIKKNNLLSSASRRAKVLGK